MAVPSMPGSITSPSIAAALVGSHASHGPMVYAPGTQRKVWWEEWEANDCWRSRRYDQNFSPADRLREAASDFKLDRSWPRQVAVGPYGLYHLWDQFRTFVGLSYRPIINFDRPDPTDETDSDSDSDSETKEVFKPKAAPVRVFQRPRPAPRQNSGNTQPPRKKYHRVFCGIGAAYRYNDDAFIEKDMTLGQKYLRHIEERDDRMDKFLYDPETSMKVLFSSYFWDYTLNCSEACRSNFATVASCFLSYVIQSEALGEPEYKIPLQKALAVAETARKQLPLTSALAYALPDDVNKAFSVAFAREASVQSNPFGGCDISPSFQEILLQDAVNITEIETVVDNDWGKPEDSASMVDRWLVAYPPLEHWLGSTATTFKATCTTGTVESSTRRILRVQPATIAPTDTVNVSLESTFTTVELAPLDFWGHSASSDIQKPVVLTEGKAGTHDPFKDTIMLLVKPELTQLLTAAVGMLLQANWVQITRRVGKDEEIGNYWYMDHLSNQFPSFYTEDLLEM